MQEAARDIPLDERLAIIESETGSGKTEAALWRFARLYESERVDSLYFALAQGSPAWAGIDPPAGAGRRHRGGFPAWAGIDLPPTRLLP